MAEKLYVEPVYHPFGGMNIDSNGVTARQNEAVDFGDQVRSAYDRDGVKGVLDFRYIPNHSVPASIP